jgi:hypothetical protein
VTAPLDELYFTWLYGQVSSVEARSRSRTYWKLFRILFSAEFVWLVANDNNRVEDGKDLRYEFLEAEGIEPEDPRWLHLGCSFLEMLIALSRRCAFLDDRDPKVWFWELLENIDLDIYNDRVGPDNLKVEAILEQVIFRTYCPDGRGGLFPLNDPHDDQRRVELWYQMNAYVIERM